jgi:2-dehydro-3-deoxygluconokinase
MVGTLMTIGLKRIGVIGEAMGELFTHSLEHMSVGIGGDTFNAAVYMAQVEKAVQPHYFSAIGTDPFSQLFIQKCHEFGINDQFIIRDSARSIGLYSITNDEDGERQFDYWRSDSAARQYLNSMANSEQGCDWLVCDALYLSGITLAIMNHDAREALLAKLSAFSQGTIYFDDNFRPLLWQNDDVQLWYDRMFNAANVLLLSVEDQLLVQNVANKSELIEHLQGYRDKTIILRDGPNPISLIQKGELISLEVEPVKPVDTTAAGDSFTGSYIAMAESGADIFSAIKIASRVSGYVIQQKGALVQLPKSLRDNNSRGGAV